jgi:hypothetical protein
MATQVEPNCPESSAQTFGERASSTTALVPYVAPQGLKGETTALLAPPPEEITALHELAMMGDIRGIQEQAKRLEQLDEQFAPFATQLHQLAKGFQEKQILEFVKKFMAGNE